MAILARFQKREFKALNKPKRIPIIFSLIIVVAIIVGAWRTLQTTVAPHAAHVPELPTHRGYTCVAATEYYIPGDFKGEKPRILTTKRGDMVLGEKKDKVEYEVSGSVFQAKAIYIAYIHFLAFPDLFPRTLQYEPTTSWSKPEHIVWDHGKLTPEVIKFHTGSVFMPESQGPEDPEWKFPNMNLPCGFPMLSVYQEPPRGAPPLWPRNGVGLSDSTGTIELQESGPLVLYLNYNLAPGASMDWEGARLPWEGFTHRNQGGFSVIIRVWRPRESPGAT